MLGSLDFALAQWLQARHGMIQFAFQIDKTGDSVENGCEGKAISQEAVAMQYVTVLRSDSGDGEGKADSERFWKQCN